MKSKYLWLVVVALAALVAVASCKTTPPAAEPEPAPPVAESQDNQNAPPDQAALDALNAAAARAAAARTLVSDFDGPTLFAQDWQSADALYSQAQQQKNSTTKKATQDSIDRYNKAADALEALSAKTLAQYYDNKQKELTDARNAAVNAGAADLIPDLLLDADNTTADAQGKYQAKDYYNARDTANTALSMYGLLSNGLAAYKVRMQIADREFEVYDPQNIATADDTLRSAAQDYSAKNYAAAKDKVDEVTLRYNLALKTAWESYAAEKGANAASERQNALNLKANVAVRQDFNSAQAVYAKATAAFQAQNHEDAANLYDESQSMFEVISQVALAKQQAAQDALQRANQKMTESDSAAKDAELILQGGAQ